MSSVVKRGRYYSIIQDKSGLILEDLTRRELETKETGRDSGIRADLGTIHDKDGVGRSVPLRWYYPHASLQEAEERGRRLDSAYSEIYGAGCPG